MVCDIKFLLLKHIINIAEIINNDSTDSEKELHNMSKNLSIFLLVSNILIFFVIITYININKKQIIPKSISQNNFTISGKAKIIDGDSIIIKKHEIRLFDIDAPEYNQTCQNQKQAEYNCGSKATAYLKKLIKGTEIKCHITGKDYYDRYLATCFHHKKNINATMISSGWAVIYNNPSKYYSLMLEAKLEKRGMWQGSFLEPKLFRKMNRKTKKH